MLRESSMWRPATLIILLTIGILPGAVPARADEPQPELDVPYEPTHPLVVSAMLELAGASAEDVVYDLGCGDGRIVINAAQNIKARGVGIDIDPQRIKEAKANAETAGVSDRVEFRLGDIRDFDLSEATVVTLYLLDHINLMIRPKLLADLKPGTRVVSHAFHMSDWESDRTLKHAKARNQTLFLWVIPAKIGGTWRWESATPEGPNPWAVRLHQEFQGARGESILPENKARVKSVSIAACELEIHATVPNGEQETKVVYRGTVNGDSVDGTETRSTGSAVEEHPWHATRDPVNIEGDWSVLTEPVNDALAGTLHVEQQEGAVKARYTAGDGDQDVLGAFYQWGASVRFEIVVGEEIHVFSGTLDKDRGNGSLMTEGSGSQVAWSAERVVQDAGATVGVQPNQ